MAPLIRTSAMLSGLILTNTAVAIDFSYLNGDPATGYTLKGAPTNLIDRSAELPGDVLTNIYNMLPESQYVDTAFIDDTLASNIVVDSDLNGFMTVEISFLNEGAGYRNTFGYFIYDPQNPPTSYQDIADHVVIFPNASKPSEGELAEGDTVDLNVQLVAGQALGFFVVPNGWGWSGSYGFVDNLGSWNQPFYSLPQLNPEPEGLKQHNVVFYDAANELFVVGFDDQHRQSGDNDFNDVLFAIKTTPFCAVDGINEDGSVDADSYQVLSQTDTTITSTSYYPSQQERGTLMYEDLWPVMGDYDFNDLIVNYQIKHTWNNENKLIAMDIDFQVQAIGASFNNGFALHVPGVPASNVTSAQLYRDDVLISGNILDPDNSEATFILLSDARQQVDYNCPKFRTEVACQEAISNSFRATITFETPIAAADLQPAPYDPYIFAVDGKYHGRWDGREWEVHLKQFSGSDAFNTAWYGIQDDNSSSPNYFVNNNQFPWALNIPAAWDHPQEKIDIIKAYPLFYQWVNSSGTQSQDWYLRDNANTSNLYE